MVKVCLCSKKTAHWRKCAVGFILDSVKLGDYSAFNSNSAERGGIERFNSPLEA